MNMYQTTRKFALASAVSVALLTSTVGFAAPDNSSKITEAHQSSQIWTTYALSPHLQAHDISVTVENGIATLTGKVSEDISKELAEQIALNVKGIKKVDSRIEVDADYTPTKATGERSYSEVVSDAVITGTVKSKLLWSRYAQGLSAEVKTESGKVTLEGTANSAEAKQLASLLASNTHGVSSVDNKLKVKKDSGKSGKEKLDLGQSISDGWITTKVKSTLMYSSNISSSDISVSTKNGVVTLSGHINGGADHALAVELAKNVNGVKRVIAGALKDTSG